MSTTIVQYGNKFSAGGNINVTTIVSQGDVASSGREKVVDWLFQIAAINQYAIQNETYGKVAPNTASWIIQTPEFNAWLAGESEIMWGVGIPGAGKTVLTSFVVNHLEERTNTDQTNELVVFLYCRFNDSLTIAKILASLLGQLANDSALALSYLEEELYTPCVRKKIAPLEDALVTHLQAAVDRISAKLYIVVDALDELQDKTREQLIGILLSLKQPLFLTSRELAIEALGTPSICIEAPSDDFMHFIISEIQYLPKLWSLLKNRTDVLADVVMEITLKSDGMFLLAALQLLSLGGITNIKRLKEAIRTLPNELTNMYEFNLQRIMNQTEDESTLACHAILWVTHAAYPLTLSELLDALAVEPDSTELDPDACTNETTLISVCCGLLAIEEETSTVRLIHYTTYDFLLSQSQGLFERPHTFMATACIVYLHLSGICHDDKATIYSALKSSRESCSFAEYAAQFIGYHLQHSDLECNSEVPFHMYEILSKNPSLPSFLDLKPWSRWRGHFGSIIHCAALYGLLSVMQASNQGLSARSDFGLTPLFYASIGGHASAVEWILSNSSAEENDLERQEQISTALYAACETGHQAVAQLLLASPGMQIDTLHTGLRKASEYGHKDIVQLLLGSPGIELGVREGHVISACRYAAMNGHTEVVQILIRSSGIDVSSINNGDTSALRLAASKGHSAVVQLLLALPDIDPSIQDKEGQTALHLACQYGHSVVAQLLLAHLGIKTNIKDKFNQTAIHYAAQNGHTKIVQLLIVSPGICLNEQNNDGETPLYLASRRNHKDIVQLLLDSCQVDVNLQANGNRCTALHMACVCKHIAVIELLLSCSEIDVNIKDQYCDTALHSTSRSGDGDIVQLLLGSPGINVNAKDQDGNTALHLASLHGHNVTLELLLRSPTIDVNIRNINGDTPLCLAYQFQRFNTTNTTAQLLLGSPGIDVNIKDVEGKAALHYASMYGQKEIVQLLLGTPGIDINIQDRDGNNALYFAFSNIRDQKRGVAELLLDSSGIDINIKGRGNAASPLHDASIHGCTKVAQQLLLLGADVNMKDLYGEAALHHASWKGHTEVVKVLLGSPAIDINAQAIHRQSALYFASWWGHAPIVSLLLALPHIDVNAKDTYGVSPLHAAASHGHVGVVQQLLDSPGIHTDIPDKNGDTPLLIASKKGHHAVVELLSSQTPNPVE